MRIQRRLIAALLLVLGWGLVSPTSVGPSRSSARQRTSPAVAEKHTSPGLSSLPLDAQRAISAALGADDARYKVQPMAGGFRSENPRHGLTADFNPQGVQVRSTVGSWSLALHGYGY